MSNYKLFYLTITWADSCNWCSWTKYLQHFNTRTFLVWHWIFKI